MIEDEAFGMCVYVDHQQKIVILALGEDASFELTAEGARELAIYLLTEAQALDDLLALPSEPH